MQLNHKITVNSKANDLNYLVTAHKNTFSEIGGETPISFYQHLNNIDYKGLPLDFIEVLAHVYKKYDLDAFVTILLLFDAPYVDFQ